MREIKNNQKERTKIEYEKRKCFEKITKFRILISNNYGLILD